MESHSRQLIDQFQNVLAHNDSQMSVSIDNFARIEGRLFAIEQDIKRIMPFIQAMELIDPPSKEEKV